jgi:hypothetical protein
LGGTISKVFVYAAGGLGNQLFQLAAAHSIDAGREIVCEIGFSGPRRNLYSADVLSHLSLDDRVILKASKKHNSVTQKILDYLLRVSAKTNGVESFQFYRAVVSLFGSIYFSYYYKSFLILTLSKGVGFHSLPIHKTNQMIIGYFQSYKYLKGQKKSSFVKMLTLKETGSDWIHWNERAIREKPLIVHIRLGDYLSEVDFGIVTREYLSKALSQMKVSQTQVPIWVFSDQKETAAKIFPSEFAENVVWVPEVDLNPAATLSIMQKGCGYVIANSTFSWWAAWTTQTEGAPVFCPRPWFTGLETPRELIPANWIQIENNCEEQK